MPENEQKKRMGRPPIERPMVRMPQMMVDPEKLNAYKAAAKAKGLTFSAWVRRALDKDSGRTDENEL